MNMKQVLVVLAAVLAAVCVLPSVDGANITDRPHDGLDFDDMNGGNIPFSVYSETTFEMTVTVTENGRTVATQVVTVTGGQTNNVSVHVSGLSVGTHQLRVECAPAGEFSGYSNGFNVSVEVDQNILSNWATYVVIIVVVIIIAIFAYLKMRDTPKNKPEMTFEELEAQRKASMAEKASRKDKKAEKSSSTERRRYSGKSDAPAEKPKKSEGLREAPAKTESKPTFEELEAQKQAEKAAKKEKKSSGKSERERYLEEKRKKNEEE